MSELLALAPYAALAVFVVFVVYPVAMAGSRIRFSSLATLTWTFATLGWLVPVALAPLFFPPGARTITAQLSFLAGFCLFGIVLIMVVAWRLNAVGWKRWWAVLTPLLPFSLFFIFYLCWIRGDLRQTSREEHRHAKAQQKAQQKAAQKASKRAEKEAARLAKQQPSAPNNYEPEAYETGDYEPAPLRAGGDHRLPPPVPSSGPSSLPQSLAGQRLAPPLPQVDPGEQRFQRGHQSPAVPQPPSSQTPSQPPRLPTGQSRPQQGHPHPAQPQPRRAAPPPMPGQTGPRPPAYPQAGQQTVQQSGQQTRPVHSAPPRHANSAPPLPQNHVPNPSRPLSHGQAGPAPHIGRAPQPGARPAPSRPGPASNGPGMPPPLPPKRRG